MVKQNMNLKCELCNIPIKESYRRDIIVCKDCANAIDDQDNGDTFNNS
jgi:hypothetical protein